jgi:hypothetical protein
MAAAAKGNEKGQFCEVLKNRISAGLLFRVRRFDLQDEIIDIGGVELLAKLWHASFPVGDDATKIIYRCARDFLGDERRAAEMPAFGSLAVAFSAVLLIGGIGCEGTGVRIASFSKSGRTEEQ